MTLTSRLKYVGLTALTLTSSFTYAQTGSSLLLSGGVTSFEGTAGGGITPWALISGYSSKEEINGTANLQLLQIGDYQLTTAGVSVGIYDRVEVSLQRQSLDVSDGITSNVFSLLTDGAVPTAPGTDIEQDIIGVKVKLFGDALFAEKPYLPQVSLGLQYKKNRDFDTSLPIPSGDVPLPGQGVPQIVGATEDSGLDIYISATNVWLGGAFGKNLLVNLTARATKANTFGLLGFESANDDSYDIEFEGSLAIIPTPNTAIGIEWRTQSNRLGGLAEEETVTDFFIGYFPSKSWSALLSYVDIGNLPFETEANGFYLTVTANW
jgi:hypothetical protein